MGNMLLLACLFGTYTVESRGQVLRASGAAAKLCLARSAPESKMSLQINKNRFKTWPDKRAFGNFAWNRGRTVQVE